MSARAYAAQAIGKKRLNVAFKPPVSFVECVKLKRMSVVRAGLTVRFALPGVNDSAKFLPAVTRAKMLT